jgi:hypothetical protein
MSDFDADDKINRLIAFFDNAQIHIKEIELIVHHFFADTRTKNKIENTLDDFKKALAKGFNKNIDNYERGK